MNNWWKKSVVYQIYPMSFKDTTGSGMGDLRGIIEKVDYLSELGVDIIWLTPIYESPLKDNGYDIADYYNINERFGTMQDFEELMEKLHSKGIKLIMDLVVNHCSDQHKWFVDAVANPNSPYKDYFIFSDTKKTDQKGFFSEDTWRYHEEAKKYYYHLFAQQQPDLNWSNENMRNEVYDMINWWLDKGIDGFRLDVINLIGKDPDKQILTSEKSHTYAHEMHQKCFKGRDVFTVGETPGVDVEGAIKFSSPEEEQFSMVFSFEHMGLDTINDKWETKKLDLLELKQFFKKWQNGLHGKGWNSLYWQNHDQARCLSRYGNDNEYRVESGKMIATLLHGMEGTPYVYQGEEIGMINTTFTFDECRDVEALNMAKDKSNQGWSDEKILKAINERSRDHARTPVQWDDSKNAGFSTGDTWIKVHERYKEINVKNALADKNSIFYTYKNLIALRKKYDVFIDGELQFLLEDSKEVFAYTRSTDKEVLTVVCNYYENEIKVPLTLPEGDVVQKNYDNILNDGNEITLRPYEAFMIISKK